jgi:hypothetical protein
LVSEKFACYNLNQIMDSGSFQCPIRMTSFLILAHAEHSALANFRSLIACLLNIKNKSDSQSARLTNFL